MDNTTDKTEQFLRDVTERFRGVTTFIRAVNYYHESHDCGGEIVKVELDAELYRDDTDVAVRFGKCPRCGAMFYTEGKRRSRL